MTRWLLAICVAGAATQAEPPFRDGVHFTDEKGQAAAPSQWKGQPVVVSMIYTRCQTRCPMAVERLKELKQTFERHQRAAQFVLITLDPDHDSAARLTAFRAHHQLSGDAWHLLSAPADETAALAKALGVEIAIDDEHIDHEAKVFIYGPDGRLAHAYKGWSYDLEEAAGP